MGQLSGTKRPLSTVIRDKVVCPGRDKSGTKTGTNENGGNLLIFVTGTNSGTTNGARLDGVGQTGQKAESLVPLSRPGLRPD